MIDKLILNGTSYDLGGGETGMSEEFKQALHDILEKVAYIDEDGQDYLDALDEAMWPPANLSYITCVYTQSGTVYDTDSLDSLKSDLVVTAHWNDNTTSTVPSTDYSLSGTLEDGTSTITVSYGGKTTTFTVTVTASPVPSGYTIYDYITYNNIVLGGSTSGYGIIAPIDMKSEYIYETTIYYNGTESTAQNIMGTRNGSGGTQQFGLFFVASSGELQFWYGGSAGTVGQYLSSNTLLNIKVMPVGASVTYPNNVTVIINNNEYSISATASGQTWGSWLGFFKYAMSTSQLNTAQGKNPGLRIGETIIRDSTNTIIHDFIPASNGTYYGFYDSIDNEFYYDTANYDKFIGGNWEV